MRIIVRLKRLGDAGYDCCDRVPLIACSSHSQKMEEQLLNIHECRPEPWIDMWAVGHILVGPHPAGSYFYV